MCRNTKGLSGCLELPCPNAPIVEMRFEKMRADLCTQAQYIGELEAGILPGLGAIKNGASLHEIVTSTQRALNEAAAELGIEGSAAVLFGQLPPKAARAFLAMCFMGADTTEEFHKAFDDARLFHRVPDEPIADKGITDVIAELHGLINDLGQFLSIATHEESEDGASIGPTERVWLDKLVTRLDKTTEELVEITVKGQV